MSIAIDIPSVNYHLWRACNMRCGFLLRHLPRHRLLYPAQGSSWTRGLHLGGRIPSAKPVSRKINFAGGEPTLCPWLSDLISRARELGMTTLDGDQWEPSHGGMAGQHQRQSRLGCVEHRLGGP